MVEKSVNDIFGEYEIKPQDLYILKPTQFKDDNLQQKIKSLALGNHFNVAIMESGKVY